MASSGMTTSLALAGNPNCGKTTLFNALTGLRQKVANYPGITVEKKVGRYRQGGADVEVLDLPGTYSLIATSPDEQLTAEVLRGLRADTPTPEVVVAVVDASNLARNLYLVTQLLELGRPLVVALNMSDIAVRRGHPVDATALARTLGVPVVPVVGHRREGIEELKAAIAGALPPPAAHPWRTAALAAAEAQVAASLPAGAARDAAMAARRLLVEDGAPDLVPLRGVPEVVAALATAHRSVPDPVQADIAARYAWIETVTATCVGSTAPGRVPLSERIDGLLLHRVWGLAFFAAIMAAMFIGLFSAATPLMDAIDAAAKWLGDWSTSGLDEGLLKSLLRDGVFAGVGAVVVFVPQIALLFLFLALLEDSGYLARAAFLMDRLLCRVGLHGKSFIPLLSSFACAIPGILATRTIDSRRERLATILIAPFMSCSARLPVYALLIAAFFAHWSAPAQGLLMLSLYVMGIIAAVATAWIGTWIRGRVEPAPFILELPCYKPPQATVVMTQVWHNTREFLIKAGTTIFALSVLIWAVTTFPRSDAAQIEARTAAFALRWEASGAATRPMVVDGQERPPTDAESAARRQQALELFLASEALDHSVAGRIGHAIEPAIAPLGFDWKIGVGLIGAFAAREVFVSTLGIVYSVGDPGDDTADLQVALHADRRPDGSAVWTPAVAVSLLVWFVLAMQCASTSAVVRRETGGWTWPLLQLVGMNLIAWAASWLAYQSMLRWWSG